MAALRAKRASEQLISWQDELTACATTNKLNKLAQIDGQQDRSQKHTHTHIFKRRAQRGELSEPVSVQQVAATWTFRSPARALWVSWRGAGTWGGARESPLALPQGVSDAVARAPAQPITATRLQSHFHVKTNPTLIYARAHIANSPASSSSSSSSFCFARA